MATKNKSFVKFDVAELPNEFEFTLCNFARQAPDLSGAQAKGVRLWPGDDRPRTFIECNLINCEPPPGSTLIDCNTSVIEYYVPDYVEELVVDGVVQYSEQFHKTVYHGQYLEDGTYDRTDALTETPQPRGDEGE